jgi:leucyl-tRNA synthetase
LYSRFWNKFKRQSFAPTEEPFKKTDQSGMILGTSAFVYRLEGTNTFVLKLTEEMYSQSTPMFSSEGGTENCLQRHR